MEQDKGLDDEEGKTATLVQKWEAKIMAEFEAFQSNSNSKVQFSLV